MTRIGRQRRSKRYNYNVNRRKLNQKNKKRAAIPLGPLKEAWDDGKSIHYNMESMGLVADPNRVVTEGKGAPRPTKHIEKLPDKSDIKEELERQAAVPEALKLQMSEPDTQFVIYMLETHGEDYKAMARDRRNYYQDTPKQIKKKIEKFKKIPKLYEAYELLKEQGDALVCNT